MAEAKGKIEWRRMGWRWWLEGAVKVALAIAIFSLGGYLLGDGQPQWVYRVGAALACMICVPLIPFLPKVGEEVAFTFNEALLGPFLIAGVFLAFALVIALIFAFFFVLPTFTAPILGPMLSPIFGFIAANKIAVLLAVIAVTLIGIYERLGKKS